MKHLFILTLAGILLAGFNVSGKQTYTVKGTVEDTTGVKIFLVVSPDAGISDTIATSLIAANGTFTFTGSVEGTTYATISVEGVRKRPLPIFLEEGTFTVTYGKESNVEGGGPSQKIAGQLSAIDQAFQKEDAPRAEKFGKARTAGDTVTMNAILEEHNAAEKIITDKKEAIIAANSDTYVAAQYFAAQITRFALEEAKGKYAKLGDNAKATTFGEKIKNYIRRLEAVQVGQVAPDFTLPTPEGGTISLYGIKGKLKLIDFWASWCGPCRRENPNVVKLYGEYHPKGLEIFGVSLDQPNAKEAWLKAIKDDGLVWKHGSDLKFWQAAPARLYEVNSIPHTILLDENNRIIAKNLRGEELRAKVASLLD
ncbi:thiol:disulfide interchange protein [Bacteroidia bacterium]|nr:thiol:disulfide interchange protein [Bacteroidia bacterium]